MERPRQIIGISLLCTGSGSILEVLQDELDMAGEIREGMLLTGLVANSEFGKVMNFLADINSNGYTGSWEINTQIRDRIETLHYTGCSLGGNNLIVSAPTLRDLPAYFNRILTILSKEEGSPGTDVSNLGELVGRKIREEFDLHDELSRLNNELINAQRELHKQNTDLEKLNQLKNFKKVSPA